MQSLRFSRNARSVALSLTVALTFALTFDASAQPAPAPVAKPEPAAPPPPPTPAPELAELAYFAGSWRCDMTAKASPFGPEHAFKATVRATWDLDKFWLTSTYKERRSRVHPMAIEAVAHQGWDPLEQRFLSVGVDNTGGWQRGKSRGWNGDEFVWISDSLMFGKNAGVRETFLKVGPREVTMTYEIAFQRGKWIPLAEGRCKR